MILFSDCDLLHEYRDDEFSPYTFECDYCYRYTLCAAFKAREDSNDEVNSNETAT